MITVKKFKNMLDKYGTFNYQISANRDQKGRRYFSGFITKSDSNIVVYLNTESCYNPHVENKCLIRYAKCTRDYTGGRNRFVMPLNMAFAINQMFKSPKDYALEMEEN